MFACAVLEEALLGAIIGGTSQARQPYHERRFVVWVCCHLWWEVQVESHVAAHAGGFVGQLQELSAKRGNASFGSDGHSEWA
jgi:hypothetical protein